jgi:hypothetical protein
MSASLTFRRLAFTLLIGILITVAAFIIDVNATALILIPCWLALFFAWPYISRKLRFDFPKEPAPRQPHRRTKWGRMFVTGLIAFGLADAAAVVIHPDLLVPSFLLLWVILFYASPLVTKRLPYFGFAKKDRTAVSIPKSPLLRTLRSSLATTGFVFIFVLIPVLVLVPLSMSFVRARRVHDSIHTGMTAAEVLHTAHDCDLFQASSEFPYDKTDVKNIPAVRLDRTKDGIYRTFDSATSRDLNLSESEAIDHLHARLHDGFPWHFHYTYINSTPEHITFIVDFGPDGRVSQVGPVYGWD